MTTCNICDSKFKKERYYHSHMQLHYNDKKIMTSYEKTSLDNIELINGIPKVVFVCWFGSFTHYNSIMPLNRMNAFKSLVEHIHVPVILITEHNYKCFEVKNHNIHEMFPYLSGNHKSDYMRAYLLHHYGGGYHDIKYRLLSWENEWNVDNWTKDDNIWIYGRREHNADAIGYPPGFKKLQEHYNKLVTMGWVICKKKTNYTQDLIIELNNVLDKNKQKLILYPAIYPGGYYSTTPFDEALENDYPLRWLEMMGEHFHNLMIKYNDKIKFGLPDAVKKKYK